MKKHNLEELVFKKIQRIILRDTSLRTNAVTLEANLNEMGNDIDSLDIFNIIADIEEEFDIHIPEAKIHDLMHIGEMVKFVTKHLYK